MNFANICYFILLIIINLFIDNQIVRENEFL